MKTLPFLSTSQRGLPVQAINTISVLVHNLAERTASSRLLRES